MLRLAYYASGVFLGAEAALSTLWVSVGKEVELGKCILVPLVTETSDGALRWDGKGGYSNKASPEDARRLALDAAADVARWFVHADGRVWRVGSPHPPALPDPDAGSEALSAKVKRAVMREVRRRIELAPEVLRDNPVMLFEPGTGQLWGRFPPLDPQHIDRRENTFLRVRIVDDDPDVVDLVADQLDRVRIRTSGEVVMVP